MNVRLMASTYFPSLLVSFMHGAVILVLPLFALDQGASWLGAGLLFALKNMGTLLMNIPASVLIAQYGERRPMLMALTGMMLACLGLAQLPSSMGVIFCVVLLGASIGLWMLGQHNKLSALKRQSQQGRSLSAIAGLQRLGMLLGPFGAGVLLALSSYQMVFYAASLLAAVSAVMVFVSEPKNITLSQQNHSGAYNRARFFTHIPGFIKQRHENLVYYSLVSGALKFIRSARQLMLPLWGHYIGLSPAEIGVVFSCSALADVALIYAGGVIADRRGRKYSAGLCLVLMSISLIILPSTQGFWAFLFVATLAGIGSGLGGGIIMVLGSDLAPQTARVQFLAAWRFSNDVYGALSPLLVGFVASAMSLSGASLVSGALGVLGLTFLVLHVPETLSSAQLGRQQSGRVTKNKKSHGN